MSDSIEDMLAVIAILTAELADAEATNRHLKECNDRLVVPGLAEQQLDRHWVCPCCRQGCTDPNCCTAADKNGVAVIERAEKAGRDALRKEIAADIRGWALTSYDITLEDLADAIEGGRLPIQEDDNEL